MQKFLDVLMDKFLMYAWWFPGKGNNVSEEALERFKQLVKEKNIPEENVEDLTTTGTVTIFFPQWTF